jgi:hypothetical protein
MSGCNLLGCMPEKPQMYGYLQEHVGSFGPAEIHVLLSAFNKAWETIQASGATFDTGAQAENARATLARHIIEAAKQGESDQGRLRDGALVAWAQSNLGSLPSHPLRRSKNEAPFRASSGPVGARNERGPADQARSRL